MITEIEAEKIARRYYENHPIPDVVYSGILWVADPNYPRTKNGKAHGEWFVSFHSPNNKDDLGTPVGQVLYIDAISGEVFEGVERL